MSGSRGGGHNEDTDRASGSDGGETTPRADSAIAHPFPPAPDGAVAVILRDDGSMLMIQRSQLVDAPGWWCFPGGRIRDGETVEQAAEREVFEETSLRVRSVRRLWTCNLSQGTTLVWILCRITGSAELVPDPKEVAGYRWITLEDIDLLNPVLPSNRAFAEAVACGEVRLVSHD